MNSCQPLWKGSQTPTKWALFLGVGEYNQGLHTGDFGAISVFSDDQCHDYDSNSGTFFFVVVCLFVCLFDFYYCTNCNILKDGNGGGFYPVGTFEWSTTGPDVNPPANTVVLTQFSQPNNGEQIVSWAFFPTGTGDCQNSGPFSDMHYDSCSQSTGTYNFSVFESDSSTCVGNMTNQMYTQALLDQYFSNSPQDLGEFMGYVSYSCGQLSPPNPTAKAPNSTLVPQSGYLTYKAFNGLGGNAIGGLVLNSCQPTSGGVVAGSPTKYSMFSVLAEVVSGTVVGYHVFILEFSDSRCHDFSVMSTAFYMSVGQSPYFLGISAVVPAPPANTVDITQYSQPNMGGEVVTWAYFPTGTGTCQNSGPNSDTHYESCNSNGNYTVTVFQSDNSTCVGSSSVATFTASWINTNVSSELLDLGYFAGYNIYTCGQLPSTPEPTSSLSSAPTYVPGSPTPEPSSSPSSAPTFVPGRPTPQPTGSPSSAPTMTPSLSPTYVPSPKPTSCPTSAPTNVPTWAPTYIPGSPTPEPSSYIR